MSAAPALSRRLAAEALGTAFLLLGVVGSGIMGERLAGGNLAVALLANSLATAGVLYLLIECLGPLSGAHFNPLVTLVMATRGDLAWSAVPLYVAVQVVAAIAGTILACAMFETPILALSPHVRSGAGQWLGEAIATFGLLTVIWLGLRWRTAAVPALVAAYIGGAYWFTSSTSFANPAVTIARTLTDTFTGIRPIDAPGFILAQCCGAAAAVGLCRWLAPMACQPELLQIRAAPTLPGDTAALDRLQRTQ